MKKLILFELIFVLLIFFIWNVSKAERIAEKSGSWLLIADVDPFTEEGYGKLSSQDERKNVGLNFINLFYSSEQKSKIEVIRISTIRKWCPFGDMNILDVQLRIDKNEIFNTSAWIDNDNSDLWLAEYVDEVIDEMLNGEKLYVRVSHDDKCGSLIDFHPKEKDFIYLLDGITDAYIQGLEILNLK